MDHEGMWYIDGIDLWLNFSIGVERASTELLRYPPKKAGIVHDWMDSHGKDYDLTRIFFDERVMPISMWIFVNSEEDFWSKYNGLISILSQPGLRRFSLKAHGTRNYYFFYQESSTPIRVKGLKGIPQDVIAYKFTITICEPEPQQNIDAATFISDEDNRLIIT